MEKVVFEFAGLTLMDLQSTLMNWVLAVQCFLFYKSLRKFPEAGPFHQNWKWFFLIYAIAFLFGGISHLFYEYLGLAGKVPNWGGSVVAVVFGELAMIADMESREKKKMLIAVIRAKLFATIILLVYDFSFKWVMVHTVGLFLFVGIIAFNRFKKGGQKEYRYFLWGILLLLLVGVIKITGIDIDPKWFNRDDLAHILMLAIYWLFFESVQRVIASRRSH